MFGGHGVFLAGLMFGLITNSELYLKADSETEHAFQQKGLERFTYYKKDKVFRMSYYQAPEEALEDGAEMSVWANQAYAVALRAATKNHKNKRE